MDSWTYELMDLWAYHGLMDLWSYEVMDSWTYGLMGSYRLLKEYLTCIEKESK